MCLTVDLQLKLIATTEKVPNSYVSQNDTIIVTFTYNL